MKTIIKTFYATMVALFTTTVFAAEPIAVWSGDFNEPEKGGLTLNLNGNTCSADNSYIEITGNNGVMVSGGNVNHSTVLIKYSNLDWSNAGSGKVISLLTHKCGAKTEANCSGIAVASNGALHGIWINNKWSNTTGGPLVAPSDASAKVSLACTFVSAAAADDEGTRAFYKDEDGVVTQVYNANGLKGTKDNTVTTDWSIGGHYGTSTGSNVKTSATGMKIYGIAIFDKWLTQAEVAAYEFPEPPNPDAEPAPVLAVNFSKEGDDTTVISSTSGNIDVLGMTIPGSVWFDSNRTATQSTPQTVTAYDISRKETLEDTAKVTWTSKNTWTYATDVTSLPLKGYLDDGTHDGDKGAEVHFTDVPFSKYDAIIMYATDKGNRFNAPQINGERYTYKNGETCKGSDTWGTPKTDTIVEGVNTLRITNLTGPTLDIVATPGDPNGADNRACIAAVVLVDMTASQEDKPTGKVINFNMQSADGAGSLANKGAQTTLIGSMPEPSWNNNGTTMMGTISSGIKIYDTNSGTTENTSMSVGVGNYLSQCGNYAYYGESGGTGTTGNMPNDYYYLLTFQTYRNYNNPDSGIQQSNIKLADVPFDKYDVIVYFNGSYKDGSNEKFHKVNITCNGTSADYTVDENGAFVAGTDDWGATRQVSSTYGVNAAIFPNVTTADFELKLAEKFANIAAFQIVEKAGGEKKVEVDCGTEYSMSEANDVEGSAIVLKFADAGGTFLIDEAPSRKYMIKCAGMVEIIANGYTLTAADFGKLTFTQVAGGIALGGGEYVVSSKLANNIKILDGATVKINHGNADALNGVTVTGSGTLIFNGNGNDNTDIVNIIKCTFDATWTGTIELNNYKGGCDRGAWVAQAPNGVFRYVNCYGWWRPIANTRANNVLSGKTGYEASVELKDVNNAIAFEVGNGWSGAGQDVAVIIKEFLGDGTFKFSWGNSYPFIVRDLSKFEGVINLANASGSPLYVSAGATYTVFNAEDKGRIVICDDGVANVASGKSWTAVNGIIVNGTIGGAGTLASTTTFGEDATIDLDKGTLTVTGTLTLPSEINLLVTKPEHGMTILNVPSSFTATTCKAKVGEKVCDLFLEGQALKLKWKIPPTIEVDIDDITIESTSDWNGGMVKIDVSRLNKGDYKEDGDIITYRLRFGDTTIDGKVEDNNAIFTLPDTDFTAGNIYRGTFELGYGDAGDTITVAGVIVYEGKLTYVEKNPWVNETPDTDTFKTTGSYDPESGVSVVGDMIQINTNTQVTFTPTPDPDYVDKCDSSFTISIIADEAIDADSTAISEDDKDAQAGVQIVADGSDGVKFQFIVGDEWIDGPDAELNKLYDVAISFHYAKGDVDGDEDSVTYTVGEWTRSYNRRENTANKVEEIIFYDGTQFASLVGTCQIEKADPVPQGMEPGAAEKELKATDETAAQTEAGKIPVVVPSEVEGDLTKGLDDEAAKEAKEKYKALFKVVAVKKGDKYVAEVVFTAEAKKTIKDDEENILTEVVKALGSLLGEEGTLENITGQPGLYYGIADGGELVNMGEAQPEEWKIADKDGNIVGLKVKKTANAKQGFYKVICTPKPTKKDN